jgi:ATP diphosphatase
MPAEPGDDVAYDIADLLRVMERLRDPERGCPWDQAQDFRSIVPSTLEESYELVAAIEHGDYPHLAEELGDVLFQVVFYSQLGREQDLFDFPLIVDTLVNKLIRRHPHVFADAEIEGGYTRGPAGAEPGPEDTKARCPGGFRLG